MAKLLLTVEDAFYFAHFGWVRIQPVPPREMLRAHAHRLPVVLVALDGARREAMLRLGSAHYSGRTDGLPAWETICAIESPEKIAPGTQVWCARALLRRRRPPDLDALWGATPPAERERVFRRMLPRGHQPCDATAHGVRMCGRERRMLDDTLEVMTLIARAMGEQGRVAEARAMLDDVWARDIARYPAGHIAQAAWDTIEEPSEDLPAPFSFRPGQRLALERARLWIADGETERARRLLRKLWQHRGGVEDLALNIAVADLLAQLAPPTERIEWYREALVIANAPAEVRTHRWRAPLYEALAATYHTLGEEHEALEAFTTAEEIRRLHRRSTGTAALPPRHADLKTAHDMKDDLTRSFDEGDASTWS